jgi:uncharacterized protein YgbK (DUF1537 family)
MNQRCLVIADDLTGGADTGVQFAERGLNTLLISFEKQIEIDFSLYLERDVLVVSTNSRGLPPEDASQRVSMLLKEYDRVLFPILYKKIDSTLRGNIGYEVDATLRSANLSLGFMAPSFPEQERTVLGGLLRVRGTPLSLTEASRDAVSPVNESYVDKLLEKQSRFPIGRIDLNQVALGGEVLERAVNDSYQKGIRVLVFDAVERQDLTHIAEAAFYRDEIPLLIGSAGLAEEVAKKIAPRELKRKRPSLHQNVKPLKHILIVSGSASKVSHEQLIRAEQTRRIRSFQLDRVFMIGDEAQRQTLEDHLSDRIGTEIVQGHAILKTSSERILPRNPQDPPIHLQIPKSLGRITRSVLQRSHLDVQDLSLILLGGDTALSVLNHLGAEGIEIEGEVMKGVVEGRLTGGRWHGLSMITKAGAFGKEDALEKIIETL